MLISSLDNNSQNLSKESSLNSRQQANLTHYFIESLNCPGFETSLNVPAALIVQGLTLPMLLRLLLFKTQGRKDL